LLSEVLGTGEVFCLVLGIALHCVACIGRDGIQGGTGMLIGNGSGKWIPRELKKLGFSFDLFFSLLFSCLVTILSDGTREFRLGSYKYPSIR
jgi:hypothetical protein